MSRLSWLSVALTVVGVSGSSLRFSGNSASDVETVVRMNAPSDSPWEKPKFCNGLDCPQYQLLNKTDDYEVRSYVATRWVTTTSADISYSSASYQNFMRLFRYISGANAAKEKIAMTCPVITRIIPGQGPACENNFTMSFFVAPSEGNPPAPTAAEVSLTQLPRIKAYVRSFGGFAGQDKYVAEAAKLAASLPATARYVEDYWYTAGYDAPYKFLNRHNEVWFIATD